MTRNIEIIVLNTTKFSDTAVVLHTLSREYGKRSFLCLLYTSPSPRD